MLTRHSLAVLVVISAVLPACASSTAPGVDESPVFFPAPPAEPRLQFLGTLSSADDIEERSDFAELVVGTRRKIALARPHGSVWWDDRLYVCDAGTGALMVFDFEENELRRAVEREPRILRKPLAIGVAPDGWKYIVDAARNVIVVLDADDRFRTTFGDPGAWRPVGLAVGPQSLYVTDVAAHRVVILDRRTGKQTGEFGGEGTEPGQFFYPVEIALGPGGDLWVTDSFNFRIQRVRADGLPVSAFGQAGDGPGAFARPKSAAIDREGRVYVVDAAFENIQVFDADGQLLLFFGQPGPQEGAMNLPAHVTLSYDAVPHFADRVAAGYELDHVVFVSNQLGTERVNVYGLLRAK